MKDSTSDYKNIVNNLDVSVNPFFTRDELDLLAKESGFVKRDSKLNGSLFMDLIIFNSENLKSQSLNDLSVVLKEEHAVDITKQSLHERFNKFAVVFLKEALEVLLCKQLEISPIFKELEGIKRILIKDSICFQIDDSLSQYYPGCGGSGSKATVRIQFEYDLLRGSINDLSLNAFNDQDAKNSVATIELVNEGDLIIRDLAYVSLGVLKGVVERAAFYLCRLNTNVKVYEKKGDQYVEINFAKIRGSMKKRGLSMIDKEVFLGKKDKFRTRLVIHLMPDDEISERIRKARENNKKKGRNDQLTDEYLARAHLNLFITNAPVEVVPACHVWTLYRLRWQIELTFKIWKSICDIEKVKRVKKSRLECYIYSKLILVVLGWKILWKVSQHLFCTEGKAMSFYKAFKTFIRIKVVEVRNVFLNGEGNMSEFMYNFYALSRRNHLLEKKQENPTSLELLLRGLGA